jgi:hypothetical protein
MGQNEFALRKDDGENEPTNSESIDAILGKAGKLKDRWVNTGAGKDPLMAALKSYPASFTALILVNPFKEPLEAEGGAELGE